MYAQIAFVGYLTEGGTSYDASLLTAYNIGNAVGTETIPVLLNLVSPKLSAAVKMAAGGGNKLEEYFRVEDTSYWEAAAHAGLETLATDGMEFMITGGGTAKLSTMEKLGLSAAQNVAKSTVDYFYTGDASAFENNIFKVMIDTMQGQASEKFADYTSAAFSNYLQGLGWPEGWADSASDLFKPVLQTGTDAIVEGGKTALETGANNIITGSEDNILDAAANATVDSFNDNLSDGLLDTAKGGAKTGAKTISDTSLQREIGEIKN